MSAISQSGVEFKTILKSNQSSMKKIHVAFKVFFFGLSYCAIINKFNAKLGIWSNMNFALVWNCAQLVRRQCFTLLPGFDCDPVKVTANTILTESSPKSSHCGLIFKTLS